MSNITTIRVTKEIRDRLKEYAEPKGLNLGAAVGELLKEQELVEKLDRIEDLLREQNMLLREILKTLKSGISSRPSEETSITTIIDDTLPNFVQGNPWVDVLSKRGSE
ncbi:hypothetical protein DRN85_09870 [Methanosarcinales archaeon]|nr:MAG: hypothetical protein DRN85_09870 [Methanosarcinales archaeon]